MRKSHVVGAQVLHIPIFIIRYIQGGVCPIVRLLLLLMRMSPAMLLTVVCRPPLLTASHTHNFRVLWIHPSRPSTILKVNFFDWTRVFFFNSAGLPFNSSIPLPMNLMPFICAHLMACPHTAIRFPGERGVTFKNKKKASHALLIRTQSVCVCSWLAWN